MTDSTAHKLYFVANDRANSWQAAVSSVALSTLTAGAVEVVPTLSERSAILLSRLMALLGLGRLRRQTVGLSETTGGGRIDSSSWLLVIQYS